jgi:hypothetical protein
MVQGGAIWKCDWWKADSDKENEGGIRKIMLGIYLAEEREDEHNKFPLYI